ncbi:sensor histidine kinase [Stigmatella aurantiaca]|uniref:histidine kinase n=1 Tax=Stigmatella aurantiaca (strain DW4/3-1) TaxID=378806 RepID=E3FM86_STIAD|nr:ATP-binding protein [Stigmatella aurantiaca]ADO69285.1 sensor protein [Stigmatella aurantiaca DW4/3-1]
MATDPSDEKVLLHVQRQSYFNGSLYLLAGLAFHCLVSGTLPLGLIVSGLVLTGLFLTLGVIMGMRGFPPNRVGVMGGGLGMVCAVLFVHWSGGPFSPYIHMFGALPFMLALFTPGSSQPTLVSGSASLVALALVSGLAGMPPRVMVLQAFSSVVILVLAFTGSRVYQRAIAAQQEAHLARLRAVEQLAESERLRGRAERERAEVERLVLMGQMAAGVAHEVNNPLAFVKANLNFLESKAAGEGLSLDRAELRTVLRETLEGVSRIQQIVTDLKDFSRAGNLDDKEGGALEDALREAGRLASVRLGAGCQVALELEPGLPAVRLGQRHVVQVMLNLLLNAVDAVEQAEPPRSPEILVRARRVEQGVALLVEDNGPGIPPEVLPRIFEPFFTTKPPGKGTGLGLALCREYIVRAGGTLGAENRPGGGARFTLRLPLAVEPVAATG